MRFEDIEAGLRRSARRQIVGALLIAAVVVGGLGVGSVFARIAGGVIGGGKLIVAGRAKEVQHPEGGVVREILVAEGEHVRAGQVLFRLDGTVAEASLRIVESDLAQMQAQEARLMAEQARLDSIAWPQGTRSSLLTEGQEALMQSRRHAREARKGQYREQIGQFAEQMAALEAERDALSQNVALMEADLATAETLHGRGLVVDSTLSAIRRERATLMGSVSSVAAEISEAARGKTASALAMAEVDEQFDESVLTELDQTRREIARLEQERIGATDRLSRLDIRAPFDGTLHEMAVHTVGGVVSAGERMVRVIPAGDLVVEARINPVDVEQIHPGQAVRLRMSGLNTRLTPEVPGTVMDVTADLSTDQATGHVFYTARIRMDEGGIDPAILRPGMPVEALIQTRSRSIAEYLVEPVTEQLWHALRES